MAALTFQFKRNAGPSLENTQQRQHQPSAPFPSPQNRTHAASLQLVGRTSVHSDETNPSESSQTCAPEAHQGPSWGTELLSANTNLRTAMVHPMLLLEVQPVPKGSAEKENAGAQPLLHRKEESTAKPTHFFFKFLAFKNQPQPPCSRCYPPVERIQTRQLFQCIYLIINTDMLLKNSFCNAIYELCKAGSLQCWHKQPLTGQNTAMYHSHSSFSTPFFFLAPVFLC